MLKTVTVPKQFEEIFQKAETTVGQFFENKEIDVAKATIKISGERYLLVRASSLSVDFFECVMGLYRDKDKKEAAFTTRQLLFDISHAIGMKDAEHFHKQMNLKDPIDKLSAGPIHFAYTGWANVKLYPESNPTPDENFINIYDHPFSFEADAWIKAGKKSDLPVCIMSAGYSSGWCEQSYGIPLVAVELTCRAKGDETCHFIMAHASRIQEYLEDYLKKKPELVKDVKNFEIPGFFKVKKAEAALVEANKLLVLSNHELIKKSEALEQKSRLIELLSEIGELLPACTKYDEIYEVFSNYALKLFPHYQGQLYVYSENKVDLECVSSWGDKKNKIDINFTPQDCWALLQNQLYIVKPGSNTPRCNHIETKGGYACIPITVGGEILGLISLSFGSLSASNDEITTLARLASDIGLTLSNVRLRETLQELSIRDYLTGLYNRRYMEEMLLQEIAKSKRNGSGFGIIMFDIDHYKEFNDRYGHEAGDLVLSTLGQFLKDYFRESDIVCRFGGEEFVIILRDAHESEVLERAETLREVVKKLPIKFGNQTLKEMNISLGVSIFPQHGKTARALIDSADEALYRAKNEGRDRLCLAVG